MGAVGWLVLMLAAATLLGARFHVPRVFARTWEETAFKLGIHPLDRRVPLARILRGTIDGFEVTVETRGRISSLFKVVFVLGSRRISDGGDPLEIRRVGQDTLLTIRGPIPPNLVIAREDLVALARKTFEGADIQTGDSDFDERILLRGDELTAVSLMDAETRKAVLESVDTIGMSIEQGQITFKAKDLLYDGRRFQLILAKMIDLAKALSRAADPKALLAANATSDPLPGVRLRNLDLALGRAADAGGDADGAKAIARAALGDADPSIRVRAALELQEEGFEVLRKIATAPTRVALRQAAIRRLAQKDSSAEVDRMLIALLEDGRREVRSVAIEALGRRRHRGALAALFALISRSDEEEVGWIIDALRFIGDPGAEPLLVSLLGEDSASIRVAAAKGLGTLGTIACVPALRASIEAPQVSTGELEETVKKSIAQIKRRTVILGHGAGELSLSDGDSKEGAVSMSDDTGALSLERGTESSK